jgi:hypothetical protein
MGESAAETVREIEEVRSDLEGKVRVLERRLPAATMWAKRVVGIAAGGGAGSTVFWFVLRRVRSRGKKRAKGKRAQIASGTTVIELALPEIPERAVPWIYGAAGAWVVLRLAQIRETRRTNKLLTRAAA